ncbi:MAG: hypothetical protein IPO40_22345 [Fibrobacteres bacterium]|nr:hypothetical protein [Fibrobacterota bacterium]
MDQWKALYDYQAENESKGNISGKDITRSLRNQLSSIQGNRCCYCRRWLYNIAQARPVEHILARAHYPQFSLEYVNLAVACYDCNQIKKDADWEGLDKYCDEYPHSKEFKKSFHPKYHSYDDHVKFVRTETNDFTLSVYTGMTVQGKKLCVDLLSKIAGMEASLANNKELANDIKKSN